MDNLNNITNSERNILLDHYERRKEVIVKDIVSLQGELSQIDQRITELTSISLFNEATPTKYSRKWSLSKKCEYVLQKHGEVCNTRTISLLILSEENGDEVEHLVDQVSFLVRSVGATLKQKVDKKIDFLRIEEQGDIFYGLIDWFYPDGNLIEKYDRQYKGAYVLKG